MTLNKRILRSIGQKKIFYIGSILLCIFTTAFIIAAVSTGQTMKKAIDRFYREYKVEDAQLTLFRPLSSDEIHELEEKYHIDMEEIRYVEQAVNDITLRIFRSTDTVNRARLKEKPWIKIKFISPGVYPNL